MLSYIILIAIQFAVAFLGAPQVLGYIPVSGDMRIFAHAAVFAVLVWLVGVIASFVLKNVRQPGTGSLLLALVFALFGAAIIIFSPQALNVIPLKFPQLYVPLFGAILGYLIRR